MSGSSAGPAGLYAVELRRMLSRRLVRLLAALAVLGIVIAGITVFVKSHKTPGNEAFGVPQGVKCAAVPPGAPPGPCFQVLGPGYRPDPRFHLDHLPGVARGVSVPLTLIGIVFGASFIGAEWRAGTVTTHLTWEPRRVRLLLTKALAAITVAAVFAILAQVLLSLVLLPSAVFRGTTQGAAVLSPLIGAILRSAVIAIVGAGIGFAVGSIGRNTAAALGASFVYLAILEGPLLGNFFPGLRRWLVVGNAIVFVSNEQHLDIVGRSPTAAGVILVIYAAAAVALATAIFRARDVT